MDFLMNHINKIFITYSSLIVFICLVQLYVIYAAPCWFVKDYASWLVVPSRCLIV
jgi:hypothetical protein